LPGAEEAGDDGARHLASEGVLRRVIDLILADAVSGGTRATTPLRNETGLSFQGTMPLALAAKLSAPLTISSR
jgi:hypothetical protein